MGCKNIQSGLEAANRVFKCRAMEIKAVSGENLKFLFKNIYMASASMQDGCSGMRKSWSRFSQSH